MKKIKNILFCAALLAAISFNSIPQTAAPILETKVYGVCGCDTATTGESKVELTLHPDHTFHYLDASNPAQKVDLSGKWAMNGKKVILQADAAEKNFHKTWKFDKNKPCIVSQKGLEFVRLCDIAMCQ